MSRTRHDASTPRPTWWLLGASVAILLLGSGPAIASEDDQGFPRTASGRPDFTGTYDVATLTPTQRPVSLGDTLALSPEKAAAVADGAKTRNELLNRASNPDREAPPAGGNVGGYNYFWLDPGSNAIALDGQYRTSILTTPSNGRFPEMTPDGERRRIDRLTFWGRGADQLQNRSDAWWLDRERGPFDGPEIRPKGERCMLGFGSPAGPPVLPVLYNNLKRVVQTETHLMIQAEMVHDARVIRISGEHEPEDQRRWLGDSVAHWEDDTLVIETRNFKPGHSPLSTPGTRQNFPTSGALRVTERLSRIDAETLRYEFLVDDPETWSQPWGGEYPWPSTSDRVYEYACHEGNYAMGNILRGARLAEREAAAKP